MNIFRLSVTAGPAHPTYPAGMEMAAICLVDLRDTEQARQKAADWLAGLGWASVAFGDSFLLPANPDTANFNKAMLEAFHSAKKQGAALIVYPERSGTA